MAVERRTNRNSGALYRYRVIFPLSQARGCKSAWPPDGHALRGAFGLIPRELRAATHVREGLEADVGCDDQGAEQGAQPRRRRG